MFLSHSVLVHWGTDWAGLNKFEDSKRGHKRKTEIRNTRLRTEIDPWAAEKESRVEHVVSFQEAGSKDTTMGESEKATRAAAVVETLRQRFMKTAGVNFSRQLRKPNDSISIIWDLWKGCIAMDLNFTPLEWRPKRSSIVIVWLSGLRSSGGGLVGLRVVSRR
jgi:hypothetical protein